MNADFLDWLDEQLDIEVAERGGFTDREAEDFVDSRKEDAAWVTRMRAIYDGLDTEYYGCEPWERPEPSTAWVMPTCSDELIAKDVATARRVLATFIDELYCRHVREMRGNKLPPGIFGIDVKDEPERVEVYQSWRTAGIRIPTVRRTVLEMYCTYEVAVEYMITPGEVVSLDFLGVPGKWYAAVSATDYQTHQERQCLVYFQRVSA